MLTNLFLLFSPAYGQGPATPIDSVGASLAGPATDEAAPLEDAAPPEVASVRADILGPDWAAFGSDIAGLQSNLAEAGKLFTLGGRACFTGERTVMGARWLVQVCSYNGTTIESVTLMLPASSVQEMGAMAAPEKLDGLYSKLRAGLGSQYGAPAGTVNGREIWLDDDGDQMTLSQGVYGLAPGWKRLYGVPRLLVKGSAVSPIHPGITLTYRQAPGVR
jgi:hypothetical protein